MNKCPYCNAEIKKEDILFFAARNKTNDTRQQTRVRADIDDDDDDRRSIRRGRGEVPAAPVEAESAKEESSAEKSGDSTQYGKWIVDQVYEDYRSDYWNAKEAKQKTDQERFIVRCTWEAEQRGAAKVFREDGGFPIAVQLCEEDKKEAQSRTGKLIRAMCPKCHCELLPLYFSIPDENCHKIGLIGYPSAGKTVYKLSLVKELDRLVADYDLASKVQIFTESQRAAIEEGGDFDEGNAKATTADAVVFPLIITLENEKTGKHLITIYDMPGEAYRDSLDVLIDHLGICECDGAMLLVDASQLYPNATLEKMKVWSNGQVGTKEHEIQFVPDNTAIVAPLNNLSEEYGIGCNIQNLALVVTKADVLIGRYGRQFGGAGGEAYLKQLKICQTDASKDHNHNVNISVMNRVDDETMRAIRETGTYKDMSDLKARICKKIPSKIQPKDIRAFTVSTLCRPDENSTEFYVDDSSKFPRHRILEPLLYLMAKWNALPTTGADWGEGSNGDMPQEEPEPTERPKKRFGWKR